MRAPVSPSFSSEDLKDTIQLFQGLLRIDTTNPPGNEGKAAEFLKSQFEKNDIDCEVIGESGRENIIARIPGVKGKPRMLLLSHTDVVPAVGVGEWKHPPFGAELEEKWIYGRGAWDDKFDAAVEAMSLILLKGQNVKLNGTLLYASVADEEISGTGAEWLTEKVPEKVAAEYVIGEGGGPPIQVGQKTLYPITVGEKGLIWIKLLAKGKAGHGSVPALAANANLIMAQAFAQLSHYKPETVIVNEVAEEIRAIVGPPLGEMSGSKTVEAQLNEHSLDELLNKIVEKDREKAEELRALTRMTISPNVIKGGNETNVIPGTCEAKVDIRLVPGQDREYATRIIKKCLEGLSIEVEVDQYTNASLSPSNTAFYSGLKSTLEEMAQGCSAFPHLGAGMSDSCYWRELGSEVYGCVPLSPDTKLADVQPGVHGPDERMNVESLEFATKFLCRVAARVLGS